MTASFTRDTFEDYEDAQAGSLPWGTVLRQVKDGSWGNPNSRPRTTAALAFSAFSDWSVHTQLVPAQDLDPPSAPRSATNSSATAAAPWSPSSEPTMMLPLLDSVEEGMYGDGGTGPAFGGEHAAVADTSLSALSTSILGSAASRLGPVSAAGRAAASLLASAARAAAEQVYERVSSALSSPQVTQVGGGRSDATIPSMQSQVTGSHPPSTPLSSLLCAEPLDRTRQR